MKTKSPTSTTKKILKAAVIPCIAGAIAISYAEVSHSGCVATMEAGDTITTFMESVYRQEGNCSNFAIVGLNCEPFQNYMGTGCC